MGSLSKLRLWFASGAILLCVSSAIGQPGVGLLYTWTGAVDNTFQTPGNWNIDPDATPDAGRVFDTVGGPIVLSGDVDPFSYLQLNNTSVTMDLMGRQLNCTALYVGPNPSEAASLTVTNGALDGMWEACIGSSWFFLEPAGAGAVVIGNGATFGSESFLPLVRIGFGGGVGTLDVLSGGSAFVADLTVGGERGSGAFDGKLHVSGGSMSAYNIDAGGEIGLGSYAVGEIVVDAGGKLSTTDRMRLAPVSGGSASLTVTGAGSRVVVSGSSGLVLGVEGGSGSTAVVDVEEGGEVEISSPWGQGLTLGSGGTFNLSGGTLRTTAIQARGGTLNWVNGTIELTQAELAVNSEGLFGTSLTIDEGKNLLLSRDGDYNVEHIGLMVGRDWEEVGQEGSLVISNGGMVEGRDLTIRIGWNSNATVTDGGAITLSNGKLKIDPTGELIVGPGGLVEVTGNEDPDDPYYQQAGKLELEGTFRLEGGVVRVKGLGSFVPESGRQLEWTSGRLEITRDLNIHGREGQIVTNVGAGQELVVEGKATLGAMADSLTPPSLEVTAGGEVDAGDLSIVSTYGDQVYNWGSGYQWVGIPSTVSVGGEGAHLIVSGMLRVGGTDEADVDMWGMPMGYAGCGRLTISTGATVETGVLAIGKQEPGFVLDGSEDLTGEVFLQGGTLRVGLLDVGQYGSLTFLSGELILKQSQELSPGSALSDILAGGLTYGKTLSIEGTLDLGQGQALAIAGGGLKVESLLNPSVLSFNSGMLRLTGAEGIRVGDGGLFGRLLTVASGQTYEIDHTATVAADGLLMVNGGSFSAGNLVNDGQVQLGNLVSLVGGQTLANRSLLSGTGRIASRLVNEITGEIRAGAGEHLVFMAPGNSNAGKIEALGGQVEFKHDLTNQAGSGMITGRDVTLRFTGGLINRGSVALSFGTSDVFGDISNEVGASIIVSGGSNVTFYDDVTNNGLIRVSDGSKAVFFGALSGAGIVGGGTCYFEGDVRPGHSPGIMSFDGDVGLRSSARLDIELANDDNSDPLHPRYDALHVAGDVAVAGTLSLTWLPVPGDAGSKFGGVYTILTWDGTRTGIFDAIECSMAAYLDTSEFPGGIEYDDVNHQVKIHLRDLLDGDADLGGNVGTSDLLAIIPHFGADEPGWLAGDLNLDGIVDAWDFIILKSNMGSSILGNGMVPMPATLDILPGAQGGILDVGTVPEPATMSMLMIGGLAMIGGRRRRAVRGLSRALSAR